MQRDFLEKSIKRNYIYSCNHRNYIITKMQDVSKIKQRTYYNVINPSYNKLKLLQTCQNLLKMKRRKKESRKRMANIRVYLQPCYTPRRPSYRKKCFQRSSTFPLRRIDTVYRVPKMSRESVGAWKNIRLGDRKRWWSMNCARVSAYTRLKFISWFVDAPSGDVGSFNRKTGCHGYPSEFYECLEPSYELQPHPRGSFTLVSPIPALQNHSSFRKLPDLVDPRSVFSAWKISFGEWKTHTGSSRINEGWRYL